MNTAPVSCIIPVYNGERYLGETLDSVLAQTCRPIEIIVIDDGSTDGTADIIAACGDRITPLRQANAGPSAARNRGLEAARGDFIALGDADDLWHPERLSRQMARFAGRPDLDICLPHSKAFWTPDLVDHEGVYSDPRVGVVAPASVTVGIVARHAVFDRIGGFDPARRTAEDLDWYMRAAESGAVIEVMEDVLVFYRLHATNMTRLEIAQCATDLVDILKHSLDRRRHDSGDSPRPLNLPKAVGRN